MKNIEKYRNLIAKGEVDALLLTSKHNRMYAAEYCVAEGVSVICKEESYYFTDRKSTRLNSSHTLASRMPSSA